MRGWWQDLTDLVLPAECGGCGRPRTVLCARCRAALSGAAPSRVRPVPEPPGLPVVHAAARYADEVRAVLLAHKERGALTLAAPLGTALAGAVRAGLLESSARSATRAGGGSPAWGAGGVWAGRGDLLAGGRGSGAGEFGGGLPGLAGGRGGPVLLVPVPSARWAVRARGHDPARRIALAAAAELRRGGTAARVVAVLRQRRAVADQAGLNSRQRLENLTGALGVVAGGARLLRGGRVVLVDDLMTTGASLAEAARAVRAARRERGPVSSGERATAVYPAGSREGRGERITGTAEEEAYRGHAGPGKAGADGVDDLVCAAVVAAPPDSFEINRN